MYLIDTSVLSYSFRDHRFLKLYEVEMASDTPKFVSVQTIGELLTWAERNTWGPTRRAKLKAIISSFGALPLDPETAATYSRILQDARACGRALSTADSWILATALQHDLVLVSHDRDMLVGQRLHISVVCRA